MGQHVLSAVCDHVWCADRELAANHCADTQTDRHAVHEYTHSSANECAQSRSYSGAQCDAIGCADGDAHGSAQFVSNHAAHACAIARAH